MIDLLKLAVWLAVLGAVVLAASAAIRAATGAVAKATR